MESISAQSLAVAVTSIIPDATRGTSCDIPSSIQWIRTSLSQKPWSSIWHDLTASDDIWAGMTLAVTRTVVQIVFQICCLTNQNLAFRNQRKHARRPALLQVLYTVCSFLRALEDWRQYWIRTGKGTKPPLNKAVYVRMPAGKIILHFNLSLPVSHRKVLLLWVLLAIDSELWLASRIP